MGRSERVVSRAYAREKKLGRGKKGGDTGGQHPQMQMSARTATVALICTEAGQRHSSAFPLAVGIWALRANKEARLRGVQSRIT